GLSNDEVELLEKHNVPNWLIKSMQKIEYLFPKAHATAYVTMALWIAWFKLYEPLAFYASYFTAHSKADDIKNMIDKPLPFLTFSISVNDIKGSIPFAINIGIMSSLQQTT
ncbi:hypothetical protein, partial [Mycoplasmopsis bovis]|uniref:hypothetical protein n=1 Tax=Mycoplasmopsis bovis TaxID=28903 RepID=UPI003D2675AC